jgi:DNA end-binding protein Ku
MYSATENKDISFHQVHDKCETRIKYQKYCPHCDRVVENDEIEKGYEFAKGQYVILDDEDFEQLPLPSKHTVEVSAFVKMEQIDPIYFEKSYYMEADEAAMRPFVLFMRALTDMEMVAIATVTLRNKERLCALRAMGGTLILDTLLYPDEIRVTGEEDLPNVKINEKELQMAEHLIELMETDFDPEQYKDHYRQALRKVIDAKLEGKEIVMPEEAPKAKVVDLMEALRASVENLKAGKGAAEGTEDQVAFAQEEISLEENAYARRTAR